MVTCVEIRRLQCAGPTFGGLHVATALWAVVTRN